MPPKKVSIITLGCDKNTSDTDNLSARLIKNGIQMENDTSKADAVVVHTCSFIESAKKESIQTILEAAKSKNKNAKLYVTGCMVQQHGKEMMMEIPEADAFLGTGQLTLILDLLKTPRSRFLDRRDPGGFTDPDTSDLVNRKGVSANLRISEGCSHPCSFCVIPKLRGGLKSREEKDILREVYQLAKTGVKELVIIGQDTGEWGHDCKEKNSLSQLLRKINDVPGLRWIRVMYLHPVSLNDDLISVFKDFPEKFPYLDMPLQHIDDGILSDMNRLIPEKELRVRLEKLKSAAPNLSLRTTFIIGFPGETEDQFTNLNNFVNEGIFDYLGAFPYSREDSTPAALKKNQIPDSLKQERHQALMATHFNVAYQEAQKRLGTKEWIYLEHEEGDFVFGRTKKEAAEIDAVVKLPKTAGKVGEFVEVTLSGYDSYEFTAEPSIRRRPESRVVSL